MAAWQIPLQADHAAPGPNFADSLQAGLKNATQLAATKQAMQAQQLDMQGEQMKNAAMQRQLQDDQIMRQSWLEANGDMEKAGQLAMQRGMSMGGFFNMRKAQMENRQALAALNGKELENKKAMAGEVGGAAQGLLGITDPNEQWSQAQPVLQNLVQKGYMTPDELQGVSQQNLPDWLKAHVAASRTAEQQIDDAIKQQTAAAATTTAGARATEADTNSKKFAAELPGITSGNQLKNLQVQGQTVAGVNDQPSWDQWRASLPQDQQQRVPAMFSPVAKQMVQQMGMSPDQQVTTAQAAANAAETARHNQADEKLSGQRNSLEGARVNIEASRNRREQDIYNQTYGPGANPALVGVDPKLRVQASSAAQKAADEYAKGMESVNTMQSILDLAKGGNKVAYAYSPVEGVLTLNTGQGIKRVNLSEIKAYGGAGSALDRVQGWLGKQATGQSIPPDILQNMAEMTHAQESNIVDNYNTKLGSVNQNYRSNFQPVKAQRSTSPSAAPKFVTKDQLHQYAQEHKIDDATAQKTFEASGYTVK